MASLRMTLKILTLLFYMFLIHGITENDTEILTLLFYMLLIHGITENDTENTDTAVLHVLNTWHH